MPFITGHKKIEGSGMKRGQKTRRSLDTAEAFNRVVDRYGDPLEALAALAFDPSTEASIRMTGLKELCHYGYAKRKMVDVVAQVQTSGVSELSRLLEDLERGRQEMCIK